MGCAATAWAVRERATEAYGAALGRVDPPVPEPPGSAEHPLDGPAEPPSSEAEVEALEALGDAIVRLAAHLHAGRARYLGLVAAFDRRGGWRPGGHTSCARWLVVRTGLDLRTAREHVRVARALEGLPRTSASMGQGKLSFSQVRALTRVATPETEEALLTLAEGTTAATLERRVRSWRRGSAGDEAAHRERQNHRARRLTVACDADGMYVVRGRLTPEVGAVLMRALEAAGDALYRAERRAASGSADPSRAGCSAEHPSGTAPSTPRARIRAAGRRRADAVGLLCERALAAGFTEEDDAPVSGTRAERYQVFVHVDRGILTGGTDAEEGTEPGRSELADGTRLAAETARRLACDAATVTVRRDPADGSVLDVGRKRRTVGPAIRRALEVRDRGCRFPGCGVRFTDAHHLTAWAEGGRTALDNLVLLCRHHHRLVHEEGWTVQWWGAGRPCFIDPRGGHHVEAGWVAPELGDDPVAALERANRRHGADPGPLAASARWKRERDVPDHVWLAAHEAGLVAVEQRTAELEEAARQEAETEPEP